MKYVFQGFIKGEQMIKSEYDLLKNALNKKYRVTFEVYKGCEESIVGILLNYNSGNLDLYNEEQCELYHITYSGLKWMLPVKEKRTKESKLGKNLI